MQNAGGITTSESFYSDTLSKEKKLYIYMHSKGEGLLEIYLVIYIREGWNNPRGEALISEVR